MTTENETVKPNIIGNEFLREIFNQNSEFVNSAIIKHAVEVLKKKVYENFSSDIYELVEHGSTRFRLNLERKNIYEMTEGEVKALFNTCLIHSIASYGTRLLIGGEPVTLV